MFLGHFEAFHRVGMEGGLPALGAEQPDLDEVDGRAGEWLVYHDLGAGETFR